MTAYIVSQNPKTKAYLLQAKKGDKVVDVAQSNDLMELLAYVYEMCEPERVQQQLGGGLQ
jgi:hypothetical protein